MGDSGHSLGEEAMRRLFYRGMLEDTVEITGRDAHHLMHVLRAKTGDEVVVVDDVNRAARMEMTAFSAEAVILRRKEWLDLPPESPLKIALAQCLLKSDKMDFVVQKAVELGAATLIPIGSRNCVVHYDEKKREDRRKRWQRIADEAAKQCGRRALMEVEPIEELSSFLADRRQGKLLFCYENETGRSVREYLGNLKESRLILLIGPEGGFTPGEAEAIEEAGGASVTLGPRILRAETAAVAALVMAQYEKGDLG